MSARLRNWFRAATGVVASSEADAPDGDLMRRFADTRDEAAFAELVRRHGPMVLATCRRLLHPDVHTADDAFQAAFLVLATRAAAVSPPERVGAFLHGIAVHVAQKARAWARKLVPMAPADIDRVPVMPFEADPDAADVRAKLDDVLAGLPSKYRAAVVLCELEGLSRTAAAGLLGWSEGTLSSRLARARKLLADRLSRRGVTLPAAGLGLLLPASAATAIVPLQLAASTVRTAALLAAGAAAGDAIPAPVAALARGVPMHTTNFKLIAVALAGVALVLGAFGLYALTGAPLVPPPPPSDKPVVPAAPLPAKEWVTKHTLEHDGEIRALAFGPDLIASGDMFGLLFLWDAKTGKKKETLLDSARVIDPPNSKQPEPVSLVRFAPDGKALYLAFSYGSIHRCSLEEKERKNRLFPAKSRPSAPVPHGLTPDGKYWLESIDLFNPLRSELRVEPNLLKDLDEKLVGAPEAVFKQDERATLAVMSSPDVVVSISESGVLRRWKKGKDKPVWEEKLVADGQKFRPTDAALAVCPLGRRIAVGEKSGAVRVFEADTGKVMVTLEGQTGAVVAVAFSPDGKRIVAGGADKTARVWDAETGKELAVLKGHTGAVTSVAFDPGGEMIATGSTDKTVRVWEYRRVDPPVAFPSGAKAPGVGPAEPDKKPTVRGLSLNPEVLYFPDDDPPKPIEITSADELAKSPAFHNDAARAAVGKQVDFSKEKVVMFLWGGSRTDRFGLAEPNADGKIAYVYKPGAPTGPARFHYRAYAVPKHVTFVFKNKSEEPEVRALELNNAKFVSPKTRVPKPVEIKSADELAKSPVFGDDDTRTAVGKLVNFSKEKLVVFLWTGSGTDKLTHEVLSKDGKVMFTFRTGTGDDLPRPLDCAFAVPKGVKVEFKDKSEKR